MTKPDVILEVLQQMAVDATDATHLIERAYAAGVRAGEQQASANVMKGLHNARTELSLDSLARRVDKLADTVNNNFSIVAEAMGNEFVDDDAPVLDIDDLLAEQARSNEAKVRNAIAELLQRR